MLYEQQTVRFSTSRHFTATYNGRGEFYSGIAHGAAVILAVETQTYTDMTTGEVKASCWMSIQDAANPGAHLSQYNLSELSDVTPIEGS